MLEVLADHEGEAYTPNANPDLFRDIEAALRRVGSDLAPAGSDEGRSVFRAAPAAWVETGVARFENEIAITDAGRAVLDGNRTYVDCLQDMFVHYRERRNRMNPFRPVLELLGDGERHDFEDIFDRVQRECGDEMGDWINSSRISGFPYSVEPNRGNPTRSVRFLIRLMQLAQLVEGDATQGWRTADVEAVRRMLAASTGNTGPVASAGSLDVSPVLAELEQRGWQFAPWQVAVFCQAVKTKPFVVLAGISGTGKTKLPRLIAAATGASHTVIPVRPDWRDSSDLLGYTDLGGRFHPGPLLRCAKEAIEVPNEQHFVLLDEMNLARVEYYFAEVLSLMEERRGDGSGNFVTDPLLSAAIKVRPEDNEPGMDWDQVYLPSNLALLGSVNMDETTHAFSRKVLDRAFVIEFSDVHLAELGDGAGPVGEVLPLGSHDWRPVATRLVEHPRSASAEVRALIDELVQLNDILKVAQLQVGYRLRDEVALFVLNLLGDSNVADMSGNPLDPIDLAVSMKILPRIQGGGPRTRELLSQLSAWAGPDDQPRMPVCAARIKLLLDRFDTEGFTSYWL